jgi:hypothetical protein
MGTRQDETRFSMVLSRLVISDTGSRLAPADKDRFTINRTQNGDVKSWGMEESRESVSSNLPLNVVNEGPYSCISHVCMCIYEYLHLFIFW